MHVLEKSFIVLERYLKVNYSLNSLFLHAKLKKMSLKIHASLHTLKMLGCFNPTLGQIWTNPNVGLKMSLKNLTQWLGLSIFDPKLG